MTIQQLRRETKQLWATREECKNQIEKGGFSSASDYENRNAQILNLSAKIQENSLAILANYK